MRKYGTWAVALAIVSATPGMIRAEGIFSRILTPGSTAASQAKSAGRRTDCRCTQTDRTQWLRRAS